MTESALTMLIIALRVPLRILMLTLLLAGCATVTPQSAAERAYGTYWGYEMAAPAASGLRLIWVTPSQTACEVLRRFDQNRTPYHGVWWVLREIVGGDGNNIELDARCRVMELIPGTASVAVLYPPHEMALAYERKGYIVAPTGDTCARLHYVIPPCFPLTVRSGTALGR